MGRNLPMVDAEPVRQHVLALQAQGMGFRTIAEKAGVSRFLEASLFGKNDQRNRDRGPCKRMHAYRARRLLAVRFEPAAHATIDGTGARRRIQALVSLGWTQQELQARIGMSESAMCALLSGKARHVRAGTHDAVCRVFAELQWSPWRGPGSVRARARAARNGWAPPAAWEDDIDDPSSTPHGVRGCGEPSKRIDWDDVEHLVFHGESIPHVAARYGVQEETVRAKLRHRPRVRHLVASGAARTADAA